MLKDKEAVYHQRKADFGQQLQQVQSKLNQAAFARLLVFLATVLCIYFYHETTMQVAGILVLGIVVFVLLVRLFADQRQQRDRLKSLISINTHEAAATHFDLKGFDDGAGYLAPSHPYASDLDIFGKNSIFQYLNRTATWAGKQTLAVWLATPTTDIDTIKQRQEATKELAPMLDWRQDLQALGTQYAEEHKGREQLLNWLKEPKVLLFNQQWNILRYALPVVTLLALAFAIAGVLPERIFAILFFLQLGIAGSFNKRIKQMHDQLGEQVKMLEKYGKVLLLLENNQWTSAKLQSLQGTISRNGVKASQKLSTLSRISARLDSRMNVLGYLFTNGLFLWDIQTVFALEKWKHDNHEDPGHWFTVAGKLDALSSLGNLAFNRPDFVFPEPLDGDFYLQAIKAGHPLLDETKRVDNDLTIEGQGQILLTTGANMAGKSTFLRSVGVNWVLAMAGAPVCAHQFRFVPVLVCTSMRTHDSLQQQESFFHAELKRLQMIIDRIRNDERVFVMLDEVLKGTNSRDQHTGSKALIEQLIKLKTSGLVATHDLQLGELATQYPNNVYNICFEIAIVDEELVFDYRLRSGISQNLNATFLMRKMGITV